MAPRKNDRPVAPTRRSGRLASRAGSQASSVAGDNDDGPVAGKKVTASNSRVTKSKSVKKAKSPKSVTSSNSRVTRSQNKNASTKPASSFDVTYAIGRILMDRKYIQTLTMREKDVVINAFADREVHFKKLVDEAETRAELLAAELSHVRAETDKLRMTSKTPMRDGMFKLSIKQKREQAPISTDTPSNSRIITTTAAQSPAVASETPEATLINDSIEFSTANLIMGTPAPVTESQPQHQPDEDATPKARTSIIGSFFKTIASPFFARRNSQESSPTQQSPQQKLGELPASRKRPAPAQTEPKTYTEPRAPSTPAREQQPQPEPEQPTQTDTTPRISSISSAQKIARAFTVPSSKNPLQETSLATITEQTETSEQSMAGPEPTPSRPPRSIASVRRALQTPSRFSSTPTRIWSQKQPPRETNADRRLEKLRKFRELDEQLKAMKEDEEVQQMTERPLKRVKVDRLVKIPHKRPGDAEGTFRMFEVDSDDEMEVDADEATRSNIFELSTAEAEPAQAPAPASPTSVVATSAADKAATPAVALAPAPIPAVAPAPALAPALPPAPASPLAPTRVFEFPSVGTLPEGITNDMDNAYLGAKFAYGLEHWKATGEIIALF